MASIRWKPHCLHRTTQDPEGVSRGVCTALVMLFPPQLLAVSEFEEAAVMEEGALRSMLSPSFVQLSAPCIYIREAPPCTRSQFGVVVGLLLDTILLLGMKTITARPPALLQCALPLKARPFCSPRLQVQSSAVKDGRDYAADSHSVARRDLILRALVIALGERHSYPHQQPDSDSTMTLCNKRSLWNCSQPGRWQCCPMCPCTCSPWLQEGSQQEKEGESSRIRI